VFDYLVSCIFREKSIFLDTTVTFSSSDQTEWTNQFRPSCTFARNIVRKRAGAKQFVLNRVDTLTDTFFELLGRDTVRLLVEKTIEEAHRQGNDAFNLTVQGLCLISGVIKGRDEPLSSL